MLGMSNQEAVRRVLSPDYVGTIEADATDPARRVKVSLDRQGEVMAVQVLELTSITTSDAGLRDAVLEAANRAEAARVLNELALLGAFDPERPSDPDRLLAPLPGPTAPRLVVRTHEEQMNHLARYINGGGLEPIQAPGMRRTTSLNGYVSLARNDRGQLTAVDVDQEWLWATSLERLNNALKEAVEQ